MKYAKPYPNDYRRPENSEKEFKKLSEEERYKNESDTFGFYLINEESLVDFTDNSKKESVRDFLEKIREKNPDRTIVGSGRLQITLNKEKLGKKAEKLNMVMVYLPPPLSRSEF